MNLQETLVYLAVAALGYAVRHFNVFGRPSSPLPPWPGMPNTPAPTSAGPAHETTVTIPYKLTVTPQSPKENP
jgi:hypothetical protein